jgi:CBS domain-containing protein
MQRGSDQHGPVQDDQLKQELRGLEQANRPTRAQEWRDPEPPADDDLQLRDPRGGEMMAQQTIADVMTSDVVGVPSSASVTEAAELMRDHDIGDVLVMDNGQISGVVTDRDVVVRVLAERRDADSTTVAEVSSDEVVSVRPDAAVSEAVQLMRDRAVRRLPVIDDDGHVQGMLSIGDLAVSNDPTSALADVSAAPPNR